MSNLHDALARASAWWEEVGARARDEAGLEAERNYTRYRHYRGGVVVRVDHSFTPELCRYLEGLSAIAGFSYQLSALEAPAGVEHVIVESVEALRSRVPATAKLRWLSREPAPDLLERGVSVDVRPLAQAGDVELSRWLLEQSVCVTNHRYGNVHAGPKPRCAGLGGQSASTPRTVRRWRVTEAAG